MTTPRIRRNTLIGQAFNYLAAGAAATAAHAALFLVLREPFGAFAANLTAITVTATANTEFHRRVTFHGRPNATGRRMVALGLTMLYDATYSSAALLALGLLVAEPTATEQTATIVTAAAIGGTARFLLLRNWVFTASQDATVTAQVHPANLSPAARTVHVGGSNDGIDELG